MSEWWKWNKWRIYWALVGTWTRFSVVVFGGCERCGSLWRVKPESSRTCYHVEGIDGRENTPVDPNRDVRLCRPCAEEHHENWDARWAEYYSGRL